MNPYTDVDDLFAWADANGSPAALAEAQATSDKRDHEARWRQFRADHPEAWPAILEYLRGERDRGERRLSMARCWEALRGRFGKGVRFDNSWRAIAARDVAAADPDLGALIETRRRKA